MAHKKAGGSAKNLRDSQSQRLGVKLYGGEMAHPGNIIIRQRGTRYFPGTGVEMGKDHTIFSVTTGVVTFQTKKRKRFDGSMRVAKHVHVLPAAAKAPKAKKPTKSFRAPGIKKNAAARHDAAKKRTSATKKRAAK